MLVVVVVVAIVAVNVAVDNVLSRLMKYKRSAMSDATTAVASSFETRKLLRHQHLTRPGSSTPGLLNHFLQEHF